MKLNMCPVMGNRPATKESENYLTVSQQNDEGNKVLNYDIDDDIKMMRNLMLGNTAEIEKWITRQKDEVQPNKLGNMLIKAAGLGHTAICQLVLERRKLIADHIAMAFRAACGNGYLETAKLLVGYNEGNHYAAINIDTNSQVVATSALVNASTWGRTAVVKWLVELMKLPTYAVQRWFLVTASGRGELEVVKVFVTNVGADDADAMSDALRIASFNGREEVLDWLLANTKASVGLPGLVWSWYGQMTALNAAAFNGYNSIVKQLLTFATPDCVNKILGKRGDSLLHQILWCQYNDKSSLHKACNSGDRDAVNALIHIKASNVNYQNNNGFTAMHYACARGHVDIIKILLSVFADTRITTDRNLTPVMIANTYGNSELIKFFDNLLIE